MITLGLVRHGATEWNRLGKIQGQTDIELNDEGREQARRLAQRLQHERWDIIYTSDLSRAAETARMANEKLGVEIIEDRRLREVHFGLVEGTTLAERVEKWGENWRTVEVGKESLHSIHSRLGSFIQSLLAKHESKKILVVSHGALIANTLKYLMPQFDTSERITNASLTIVQLIEGMWHCPRYNCTTHLD